MKELLIHRMGLELKQFLATYPSVTFADLQTFLKGYQAAIDVIDEQQQLQHAEDIQMAKLG
jgi:uncharacterized protein (DUF433 family)